MARQRSNLTQFAIWLRAVGRRGSTVNTYVSHVRRLLAGMSDVEDQEGLIDVFLDMSGQGQVGARVAWSAFVRFGESSGVRVTRLPKNPQPTAATSLPPVEIWLPLRQHAARNGLTPDLLRLLQWLHVTDAPVQTLDEVDFRLAKSPLGVERLAIPEAIVAPLQAWGAPEGEHAPFLPDRPGSLTPMRLRTLRKYLTAPLHELGLAVIPPAMLTD